MSVKEIRNTLMKKCNLHKTHNTEWRAKRVILDETRFSLATLASRSSLASAEIALHQRFRITKGFVSRSASARFTFGDASHRRSREAGFSLRECQRPLVIRFSLYFPFGDETPLVKRAKRYKK